MVYIFNPSRAPEYYGNEPFAPQNYSVVTETKAVVLKEARIGVQIEGDPAFVPVWKHYSGMDRPLST